MYNNILNNMGRQNIGYRNPNFKDFIHVHKIFLRLQYVRDGVSLSLSV